jgi:aldose 1-epimerase
MKTHCSVSGASEHPVTGEPVADWHLHNTDVQLVISSYGLRLKSLLFCDSYASPLNLVLGLDSFEAYQRDENYLGAVVGRFASRIRYGVMHLGDQQRCSIYAN